jgi:hypothetical protein
MATALPRLRDLTTDAHLRARALDYSRWIGCGLESGGSITATAEAFVRKYPNALSTALITKAATDIGTTTDPDWANPLVGPLAPLPQAFLQLLSERTLLGQLDTVPVPFYTPVAVQTGAGVYSWSGEAASKPVTALSFASMTLRPAKASGVVVVSRELAQLARPGSDRALLESLSRGVSRFLDQQFTDPTNAAVDGVHPGSITNGVTPITSTGNAINDVKALVSALQTAHPYAASPVLMLSPANAVGLGLALTSSLNLPIATSSVLGQTVILADGSAIAVAEGEMRLDLSRHAVVQMDSAPATPPISGTTTAVSLWQQNLVGLRAERMINWVVLVPGAVQWMTTNWTTAPV